jgi:hypothetical protein
MAFSNRLLSFAATLLWSKVCKNASGARGHNGPLQLLLGQLLKTLMPLRSSACVLVCVNDVKAPSNSLCTTLLC